MKCLSHEMDLQRDGKSSYNQRVTRSKIKRRRGYSVFPRQMVRLLGCEITTGLCLLRREILASEALHLSADATESAEKRTLIISVVLAIPSVKRKDFKLGGYM